MMNVTSKARSQKTFWPYTLSDHFALAAASEHVMGTLKQPSGTVHDMKN